MSKLSLWIASLGAGALLALLQACSSAQSATQRPAPPPLTVTLAPVQGQRIAQTGQYVAQLQSRRSVQVKPQVEGRIRRILSTSGEMVKAGGVLMEIDSQAQQALSFAAEAAVRAALAEQDNARAQLATLQAEHLEAQTAVQYAGRERDRYARLQAEGAISRQELDRYETNFTAAQARLTAVESRLDAQHSLIVRAGRAVEQARAQARAEQVHLRYFQVSAPIAGQVGEIPVRVGDYVTPASELTTLTDNRQLEVHIAVPVEQAAALRPGLPVALSDTTDAPLATARIQFVSPRVDAPTQTVLIKAVLENPNGRLRADQFVRARLISQSAPGVVVPAAALMRVAGQDFVFVAQRERGALVARQRAVALAGDLVLSHYAVRSGLKPGELVVVSGTQKLTDGAPIQPTPVE